MVKVVTEESLTTLADRIIAIREVTATLKKEEEALKEQVVAAVESGITVAASDGTVAKVSKSERRSYRVKEVLAMVRREKLDAGKYFSVTTSAIKKLPETLTAALPFTSSISKVLKFGAPEPEVTLTVE